MKARTLLEWWNDPIQDALVKDGFSLHDAELVWQAAQDALFEHTDGDLPEAVRVPPVETWPENASAIAFPFVDKYTNLLDKSARDFLSRPVPKWVPSKGEAVFLLTDHGAVLTGICGIKLGGPDPEQLYDVVSAGIYITVAGQRMKPFDAAKIGLPWSKL